jgi:phosphatidate cytidylyltransferase
VLRTRVLSATVILAVVSWAVWFGGWWMYGFAFIIALIGGYEYFRMMGRGKYAPSLFVVLAFVLLFFLNVLLTSLDIVIPGFALLLMVSISLQMFRSGSSSPTLDWGLSVAGGIYVGALLVHLVYLRSLPDGLAWTALAILTTWISDSGAFFLGRAFGRHKLAPRLSPGKTWEGIVGGVIGGLLAGGVIGGLCMQWLGSIGVVNGLIVGLLVSIVAPFGDLAISMLKREAQVKDSGSLIPGHGGMLDRTDSIMFVVVTTYYYATWLAR